MKTSKNLEYKKNQQIILVYKIECIHLKMGTKHVFVQINQLR